MGRKRKIKALGISVRIYSEKMGKAFDFLTATGFKVEPKYFHISRDNMVVNNMGCKTTDKAWTFLGITRFMDEFEKEHEFGTIKTIHIDYWEYWVDSLSEDAKE